MIKGKKDFFGNFGDFTILNFTTPYDSPPFWAPLFMQFERKTGKKKARRKRKKEKRRKKRRDSAGHFNFLSSFFTTTTTFARSD